MKIGDIAKTRTFNNLFSNPKMRGSVQMRANKGMNMVFLFLGGEKQDEPIGPREADERLNMIGWRSMSDSEWAEFQSEYLEFKART